jgi:hypothetical protein
MPPKIPTVSPDAGFVDLPKPNLRPPSGDQTGPIPSQQPGAGQRAPFVHPESDQPYSSPRPAKRENP